MAFNIKEQWKQINKDTDKVLWIIVILLAIFSILAVFSTSNKLNVAGSSFLFLLSEHIVYVLLGIGLMFALQKFPPYKAYGIHGRFFLILAIVLLVATLFFGVSEGGSKRSISVLGHKIQTIHMIELCIVIHFSSWLKRVGDGINDIKHVYIPMLLYILVCCLLIATQKTSASLILGFTLVVLLFLSQLKLKYFLGTILIVGVAAGLGLSVLLSDAVNPKSENAIFSRLGTMKVRIESFLDKDETHKDIITTEAAIATSRFLPMPGASVHSASVKESYSDYIFAFFVEEYGILFGIIVVLLYLSLFYRTIKISKYLHNDFGKYLALGLGFMITFQAITHICVCVGVFPATGETLPMFSKGGISIVTTSVEIGILMNISRVARQNKIKEKEIKSEEKQLKSEVENE